MVSPKIKMAWAVVTPDGTVWPLVRDQLTAWGHFFRDNNHRLPLYEAIRAYEAIGYRLCEFSITPTGVMQDCDGHQYGHIADSQSDEGE